MPYHMRKRGAQWCVEKQDGSKRFGCHSTRGKALAQISALYANEPRVAMRHEELRSLHLRVHAGTIRTERYDGVDYTVVPVTALVEGVIRAINSPNPEFVSADRFSVAPSGWNGRPVFINHPMVDGAPVSGNTPEILKTAIGRVFNARVDGKRLLMEAWLHPVAGKDIIARHASGEMIEISTGAFVLLKDGKGTHDGKAWSGSWDTIIPDHLAILGSGLTGACSVAMGCGVRAAMYDVEGDVMRLARDITQKERDKMSVSDFAGKGTSFPIKKPADVAAAAQSMGRAGSDNYSTETLKKNIIAIAKRKGAAFVSQLPEAWKSELKGATMRLRDKVKVLMAKMSASESEDAEDTAELIAYQSLSTLIGQAEAALGEGRSILDDLIADESDDSTGTAQDDEADDEIEAARLESLQAMCLSVMSAVSGLLSITRDQLSEEEEDVQKVQVVGHSVMSAAMRAAKGAEFSAKNRAVIQTVHDHAVKMGAKCDATNAYRNAEQLRAAACGCGALAAIGGEMKTKAERIVALMACEHNPYKNQAALEASSESGLAALEAHVENASKLRAAMTASKADAEKVIMDMATVHDNLKSHADAAKKKEPDMKAAIDAAVAAVMPKTDEDWLKMAPSALRTLVEDAKAADAAAKIDLVTRLKAAQKVYSEAELNVMDVKQLTKIASLVNVQPVDFSGRGAPRLAEDKDYIHQPPPDGYRAALDAKKEKVN